MTTAFPFITTRVHEKTGLFGPLQQLNHCLVNEYLSGQGIMPHEDGPSYVPTVATLSLGSHTILDIYRYTDTSEGQDAKSIEQEPFLSVYLPARSLFVMKEDLYIKCLHGIAFRSTDTVDQLAHCVNAPADIVQDLDRSRRVSLTMRRVDKVKKLF